jgi:tricarballylate dehydrogenase
LSDLEANYEVLVVGAGNAGLAAAISAAEQGCKVAVLEKANKDLRGGNTYFTGGDFRFGWNSLDEDVLPLIDSISESAVREMRATVTPYTPEQFYDDVMRVTEGCSDPDLLQQLVTESLPTIQWLRSLGHVWYPSYDEPGASVVVTMNGGGAHLSDHGFDIAAKMGIDVRYENILIELLRDSRGGINGVYALTPQGYTRIHAKAVILACGGFESNAAMRTSYLGAGWDRVKVRGVPFNTGDGLRAAWDIGAQSFGNLSGCHATPQDIDRPAFSVRIGSAGEYRRHAYPWGVMVNVNGARFVDEGADMRAYTYAKTGAAILRQPQGVAFQIFDKKTAHLPKGYGKATGAQADTLESLAEKLGLDAAPFVRTLTEFNQAVQPGDFDHHRLDGKATKGLAINKSNWAVAIDTPPYYGYGVCCGITFTFGGLRINTGTQVLSNWEAPIKGLYACGEIVGGFFYGNYAGGSGLMQGATYGRIAGRSAAAHAKAA